MSGRRTASAKGNRRAVGAYAAILLALTWPLAAQQPQAPAGAPSAQQTSPPSSNSLSPPAQEPASTKEQEPGAGAQVHTGTSSGLDAEARLRNLLADHQFARIAAQLDQLPAADAQFYRGILANRSNDSANSIRLLEPLLDAVTASGDKVREKLLRKALAEDYLRSGDVAKAAQAYQALNTRLAGQLSSDEKDEIELPVKLLPLAQANPPMTVEPCEPFVLQVSNDPLGLIDIPVFVDAAPHSWMLDPTAPFNLIARSLAKEVGLKVSEETATVRTLTGRPIPMHMAVVPRFTIGGRLTLRNMTVFVFEDADYSYPRSHYRVQGVLGYPALSALGSLTITDNATIEVQPAKQPAPGDPAPAAGKAQTEEKSAPAPAALQHDPQPVQPSAATDSKSTSPPTPDAAQEKLPQSAAPQAPAPATPAQGVPFYLDGDQIVVALGKAGDERIFAVDTGGQQSYLTSRYYAEHSDDFAGQQMALFTVPGAPPQPAYTADGVALPVGPYTVHVHYLPVLTQPLGSAAMDDVYGVLGIDALEQLKAYTFDYRTMRFSVRPE
jgi:hypothetical protein